MFKHDWTRFFPFEELSSCQDLSCVGGHCCADASKVMCGFSQLQKLDHCVVCSIGGNNKWQFENAVLEVTPCDIHAFDCMGDGERFNAPKHERLHFHHVCITPHPQDPEEPRPHSMVCPSWTLLEMQQKLGHSRIDLLKMDIEGFELPLMSSWPESCDKEESEQILLPMQMLAKVHCQTQFEALHPDGGDFKTAADLLEFQRHLMRMGHIVTIEDDNRRCKHCAELTFARARCPNTGVHANMQGISDFNVSCWMFASFFLD